MLLWRADKCLFFPRRGTRLYKGISTIEVLVTSVLLILGISVVMKLSNFAQQSERNAYLALTAEKLAQDLLERVLVERCVWNQVLQVCHNLTARDMGTFPLWVQPNGEVKYTKEEAEEGSFEFEARFDVQTTSGCLSGISNANCTFTVDDTSAWGLDRTLFEGEVGNLHNVRVTVSYVDPFDRRIHFTSYQTRVAP